MKPRTNTMSKGEFVLGSVFWLLLFYITYNQTVFRALPELTCRSSKIFLWVLLITIVSTSVVFSWEHHRNNLRVFVQTSLAYGVYTILAYWRTLSRFLTVLGAIVGVCCVSRRKSIVRNTAGRSCRNGCGKVYGARVLSSASFCVC